MKLHLPKLLLTAVLGMACFPSVCAGAEHNLLSSSNHWTLNAYTYQNESISKTGWGGSAATYDIDGRYAYVVGNDSSLTFSLSYIATEIPDKNGIADNDSVFNLVFSGAGDKAIMVGSDYFGTTSINYGLITEKNASQYFGSSAGTYNLTSFKGEDGNAVVRKENQTYQITGTVSRADNGNYSLTLNLLAEGNIYTANNIDLGDSFDIRRIVFSSDGGNRTLTGLSITGDLIYDGYLTTVAGNKNAADLSWVSKGAAVNASDINWTDGSAVIGLNGAGEDASITFAAGTNVSVVEVLEGAVTLKQEDGNLTIGELASYGNAVLASNMTVNSIAVGGEASIAIADNAVVSYTGSNMAFLSNTTGAGTIVLSNGGEIAPNTTSDFAGVLDVAAGKTLGLSRGQSQDNKIVDIEDATIRLNAESTLWIQGHGVKIGTVDVVDSSTMQLFDGDKDKVNAGEIGITVGELKIAEKKTLTVEDDWEAHLFVQRLNAAGNLTLNHDSSEVFVTIGSITKSGSISNKGRTTLGVDGSSVLNLGGNITNSGTLNIKGNLAGTSTISGGTINIKEGASVSGNITFGTTVNMEAALTNTGTLTFSEAVDLSNGITNTGTLNFSKGYSSVGTLTNEGIFNLTGNVTISDMGQLEDSGVVTYSHNDGKDGYITGATYFVVESTGEGAYATVTGDSKLMHGSAEIGSITSSGGNLVVSVSNENANSGVYYINTQDLTVDASADNIAVNATGYYVAKDRTLTITEDQNATMTVSRILTEASGEGNITLKDCTVTLDPRATSQAEGKLTVQNSIIKVDSNFTGGADTHHNTKNSCTDLSSFSSVKLDGATIEYIGTSTHINDVTVGTAGATLKFNDMGNDHSHYFYMDGTTLLNGALTIEKFDAAGGAWKYGVRIESLSGTGNLNFTSASEQGRLTIDSVMDYDGTITMTKGAAGAATLAITTGGDASFNGIKLVGGATGSVSNTGALALDVVELSGGSSLTLRSSAEKASSATIGKLTGNGNLVINDTHLTAAKDRNITISSLENYSGEVQFSGLANGMNLNVAENLGLTVRYSSYVGNKDEIKNHMKLENIGAGNTLILAGSRGYLSSGAVIAADIQLVNADGKAGLELNDGFFAVSTFTGDIRGEGNLVINKDNLQNHGLTFTGDVSGWNGIMDVAKGTHTITYTGDASEVKNSQILVRNGSTADIVFDHTKAATVTAPIKNENSTLNLVVKNTAAEGTTFNGSVQATTATIKAGTVAKFTNANVQMTNLLVETGAQLAFTATEALSVNSLSVANVGKLTVANGDAAGSIIAGGAVTLAGGATINAAVVDLRGASSVSFDVASGAIALNGALTMSSTGAFVAALGDSLAGLTAGDILTVFTGVSSFTVGDVTYSAESENQLAGVDLSTWDSDVAVGQYTMTYDTYANVGSIVITVGEVIPEPASATLSLAALMMLCARRRRRA